MAEQTTPSVCMPLGERLRQLREGRGLSQADLAGTLHLTRQTISGWECGRTRPDIDSVRQLAEIYDLTLDELLNGVDAAPKRPSRWRWLFLVAAVLLAVLALLDGAAGLLLTGASSIGIIGGSDGPTAIFITGPPVLQALPVLTLLGLAAAFFCIYLMMRWRGSHTRRHYLVLAWVLLGLAGLYLAVQTVLLFGMGLAGSAGGWLTWAGTLLNPGFLAPLGVGVYALVRYRRGHGPAGRTA